MHVEDGAGLVLVVIHRVRRDLRHQRLPGELFFGRARRVPEIGLGQAAREMPDRRGHGQGGIGRGQFQDIRPAFEADEHEHGSGQEAFQHRHGFDRRPDVGHQTGRGLLGFRKITVHGGVISQEMQVMAVIHQGINALLFGLRQKGLVRRSGHGIAMSRRRMIPHPRVNMRGHVHQVTGSRRELLQPGRTGQGALGMRRRFHGVDIIMIRSEMMRVAL